MGEESEEDPYREFAVEVLLNPDRIDHDIELIDEYAEKGYFKMVQVDEPDLVVTGFEENEEPLRAGPEEDIPYDMLPPGRFYYYQNHHDPDIVVMMTEVDDTRMVEPFFPGKDMGGLSLSFVVPTKEEIEQQPVKRAKMELMTPFQINDTIVQVMEAKGYFTHPLMTDDYQRVGLAVLLDNASIMLYNRSTNDTSWAQLGSGIIASVDEGGSISLVNEEVRTILELQGFNSSLWTGEFFDDTTPVTYPVPDIEGDMSGIDWSSIVGTELKWLSENGFISGLDETDLDQISSLAQPGASGINHRIVYDEGQWKTFDQIGEIPMLGGGYEDSGTSSLFDLNRGTFPVPPDREDKDEFPYLILIVPGTVLVVVIVAGGSFGYARHKRSELLENTNRKRLFDLINSKPGIHFSEVQRELDLKQGVLSYHVNVLEKNEFIKSIQDGTYRRFYPYDEKIELQFRLHEMQEKILMVISQKPGITQSKISKQLGRNKMVINYHLKILLETGILHMEREGRETHCFIDDPNYMMAAA